MSSSGMSARVFRPQNLAAVLGQEHITRSLHNAIKSGQLAQAYLFSGPRGVGKTSLARILSKSLNCEKGPTVEPCQSCSNCIEIKEGSSYDVLEIDGASNRGIEQIRELRDSVQYLASKSRYKVFIIDEVHMLTDQAFNALLKTLEEPPEHVIFILATTEVHKVKLTIRSRCQQYRLKRIALAMIQKQLAQIAKEYKVEVNESALYLIAQASDGSLRDAEHFLDQAMNYSREKIDLETLHEVLGTFPEEYALKFIQALSKKDLKSLLELHNVLTEEGEDLGQFSWTLIKEFRTLLFIQMEYSDSKSLSPESLSEISAYKEAFTSEEILKIIQRLIELHKELKKNLLNHSYLFEASLFELIDYKNWQSPDEILRRMEELEKKIFQQVSIRMEEKQKTSTTTKDLSTDTSSFSSSSPSSSLASSEKELPKEVPKREGKNEEIDLLWQEFLKKLALENPKLESFLSHARIQTIEHGILDIFFSEEDSFFYEDVSQRETLKKIQSLFESIHQKKLIFRCTLDNKSQNTNSYLTQEQQEQWKDSEIDSEEVLGKNLAHRFKGKVIDSQEESLF